MLDKLYNHLYVGEFEKALKILNKILNKYKISPKLATYIIGSCGSDMYYDFVKPLVDLGGTFDTNHVEFAEYYLEQKKSHSKERIKAMPQRLEAYRLVIKEEEKKLKKKSIKHS